MNINEEDLARILAGRLAALGDCPLTRINEPDCPGSCRPLNSNAAAGAGQCVDCIVESARSEMKRIQSIIDRHSAERSK